MGDSFETISSIGILNKFNLLKFMMLKYFYQILGSNCAIIHYSPTE